MEYKARIFIDGKMVEPSDYPKIFICSKTVDRIVNDVYERVKKQLKVEEEEEQPVGR